MITLAANSAPSTSSVGLGVAAGIATIIAALVGFYLARSRKQLNEAQATEAYTNAAVALFEPQQKQITELRERAASLETKVTTQDQAIIELRAQRDECLKRESETKGEVAALHTRLNEVLNLKNGQETV